MTVRCHLGSSLDCTAILITALNQQVLLRMTKKIQMKIGRHKFCDIIYHPTDMEVNGARLYVCSRGQQCGMQSARLWLARRKDGRWVAYEAHKDSKEPLREGKKMFKTKFAIDELTNPDDVEWLWHYTHHPKEEVFQVSYFFKRGFYKSNRMEMQLN